MGRAADPAVKIRHRNITMTNIETVAIMLLLAPQAVLSYYTSRTSSSYHHHHPQYRQPQYHPRGRSGRFFTAMESNERYNPQPAPAPVYRSSQYPRMPENQNMVNSVFEWKR